MPDRDAFDAAYGRLAATRLGPATTVASMVRESCKDPEAVRWAASRLLPRLTALAPRRRRRARPLDD